MACRIQNLGTHRLALNLRGGEVLYLNPQEISRPLREESLYENMFLDEWRQRGLVRWIDAKMSDVLAAEGGVAANVAAASDAESADVEGGEAEGGEAEATKPRVAAEKAAPKRPAAKSATTKKPSGR
jgi:hypothetical protein